MPKNPCLFCAQKARSKEHVFPAAFGGRREEKGIYCGTHNRSFGRHVSVLLDELDILNAMLGIRPDRKDMVRPAPVQGADGETYLFAQGRVEIAPPPDIDESYHAFGIPQEVAFSSWPAAQRWMARQNRRGYRVKAKESRPETEALSVEPFRV